MSKESKNGQATRPASPLVGPAAGRPPATVRKPGVHGPQERITVKVGSDRLRELLQLSHAVDVETVCDEAADRIQEQQRELNRRPA